MSEGPPGRLDRASLPHILVPWAASEQAFWGRGGGGKKPVREIGDVRAHARKLTDELEAAQDTARQRLTRVDPEIAPNGFALSVESWSDDPVYKLAVQSLDASGAKLLSVVPGTDASPDRAVVWFPFTTVPAFFKKIEQFATETTTRGVPRNNALVANIAELRLAVLRDLWQEEDPFPEPGERRWWEVWLARLPEGIAGDRSETPVREPEAVLQAVAVARGWRVVRGLLTFPDNVVALVETTGTELAELLTTNAIPSELHRPRVAAEILGIEPLDQNEFVAELAGRIKGTDPDAAAVCVLDTGVMAGHPLLSTSIDRSLSALDGVGPADIHGHGTKMAGLALFADLEGDLMGTGPVTLRHRLESVKIIRRDHDTQNDPEAYPVITASATAAVEAEQPRQRVFSMAVTVDDPAGSDGRPTSYSAAFDALAFGTDIGHSAYGIELLGQPEPEAARLYVVSAGNVREFDSSIDHFDVCDLARVQNPAHAWNVLTVGAHTELVNLPKDPMYAGWEPLAEAGELSPFSRTSTEISRSWPIKKVRLRVTLSYFVEPNPSNRGWQGRYRYASHGLRFDVKRPTETLEDFQRRLGNAAAREEGDDAPQQERSSDDRWYIGSRFRNSGSLHADIWTGTGAELADSGYIGITPVGGWWKDNGRSDRTELPVRYALLVSLRTDAVATDIYTPIATQIGIPVAVTT